MKRLLPRSLAAQLIVLLLAAVMLAQFLSFIFFSDERQIALLRANRDQFMARTATIVRLIERTPEPLHGEIVEAASTADLRFWLSEESTVDPADAARYSRRLAARLGQRLPELDTTRVLVEVEREPRLLARLEERVLGRSPEERIRERRGHWRRYYRPLSLTLSVGLPDGRWLNAENLVPPEPPSWTLSPLLALMLSALAIALITMLVVRRVTRPLRRLAEATEAFGRGESRPPLAETGPEEVRRTTQAFNRMQQRIRAFLEDRMRMLAAISHDLRTPLTALRLRAEMVDDAETREKMLGTLKELEQITEATLAFAREESSQEETRTVDLAALVESIASDYADLGQPVAYSGPERFPLACRPTSLRRALRNLVDNALAYGGNARLILDTGRHGARGLLILIEDDGPGIPEDQQERIFEPFVRLEKSRSRETGGIGLGMAIARTIVRSHGGDVRVENRAEGGLRVEIALPRP